MMHRRKEDEGKQSKHHGTAKESTSEQKGFNQTEITFPIYVKVQVVGMSLWSGMLAGWQMKISFKKYLVT